jgi:transcriptional regulator GlxA family with amidase domain
MSGPHVPMTRDDDLDTRRSKHHVHRHRAAAHWRLAAELAQNFPKVEVDCDAIFVRDGDVITSAGVTAGIDLALSLVEEDFGADVARATARYLVVFMARGAGSRSSACG